MPATRNIEGYAYKQHCDVVVDEYSGLSFWMQSATDTEIEVLLGMVLCQYFFVMDMVLFEMEIVACLNTMMKEGKVDLVELQIALRRF